MNPRIERLRESLEEPLLVTNPVNIHYLFGFKSSNAALLVEPDRARLFTDFRYSEAARAVEGVEFEETKRALLKDLAERLSGPVGLRSGLRLVLRLRDATRPGSIEPIPRRALVERLRAVKDEEELASIARACEITDRMFERLVEERFVGRTERDLAWTVGQLFREEGADAVAFETIVASGPNSARPHSRATDRQIGRGETVLIDTGCVVGGYASDYTRTFTTGFVDGEIKRAYAVVLAAQQAGLDALRAGVRGARRRCCRAGSRRRDGLRRNVRAWPRARARPRDPRSAPPVARIDRHTRGRQRRRPSSRASIWKDARGSGSRTTLRSPPTECGTSPGFRKDLITVG